MPSVNVPMKTMKQFFFLYRCWDPLTRLQLYVLFRVRIRRIGCRKYCIYLTAKYLYLELGITDVVAPVS